MDALHQEFTGCEITTPEVWATIKAAVISPLTVRNLPLSKISFIRQSNNKFTLQHTHYDLLDKL